MVSKRSIYWIYAAVFIGTALLVAALPVHVNAQQETPPADEPCLTCHQDRYYLFDHGRWFCMCARRAGCTVCHLGDATATDQKLAHAGLIANPLQDNIQACQNCHPDDYDEYVDKFILLEGIEPSLGTPTSPAPNASVTAVPIGQLESSYLVSVPFQPWQWAGLTVLGAAFLGWVLFTCKCWSADQATKFQE